MANNHHSYTIGDIAQTCDIETSHAADAESKRDASSFRVGDGAFIRRSDRIWRYAVVSDVSRGNTPFIIFTVSANGSTKKVGPRHCGDQVRPLKRQTAFGCDRKNSGHFKEKGQRSSCHTQTTSPFDRQSSAELERSAYQAGGDSQRRCVSNKSSDDGYADTNEPAEVLDEAISKQRQPEQQVSPSMKRRESFKDMASGFIRKVSGESRNPERRAPVKHLARNTTKAPEGMKIHEFNERLPSPIDTESTQYHDETPVAINTIRSGATNQNRRKPNSRRNRGSFTLTTSLLFKNLMKGMDVLGDSDLEAPKAKASRRATVDFVADNEEANAAARCSDGIAPPTEASKYKLRRSGRRATVHDGPSPAIINRSGAQRETSASFVMKNVFTQLMEEKKRLHLSQ